MCCGRCLRELLLKEENFRKRKLFWWLEGEGSGDLSLALVRAEFASL